MTLHFESFGEDNKGPLIFVHGAGGSSATWFMQLRGLSDKFHIIALDLNGHGKSPDRCANALASYLQDIDEIVSKYEQPILAGHSMGGALTQIYALEHPEKLRGIILIGTGARLKVAPIIFELLDNEFEEYVSLAGQYMFHEKTSQSIIDASKIEIRKCSPEIVKRDFILCNEFDIMSEVDKIKLPTLILVGDGDVMTPAKYSNYLHDKLSNSEIHIIHDAGHSVMIEQPTRMNEIVAAWVEMFY